MSAPSPREVVEAITALTGEHEGARSAHAKGTLMAAEFVATPEAARLTRAPHMQGETVPATVRFSNGGGDPNIPDYAREGRGIAIKLYVDDDTRTDMVGLSLPSFFVRTPEDFLEFTQARAKGLEAAGAFLQEHPEGIPAIQVALGAGPPESYTTVVYNGIHSFHWTNAGGERRAIRWRLEPEAGVAELADEDAKARGRDYLQEDIVGRAGAAWRMSVAIAEDGDVIDDPTEQWPSERERIEVGRLTLTGPETGREQSPDDVLVFDPTRCIDGIEPSGDPILLFRPRAYAVSVERRSGAPIPSHLA